MDFERALRMKLRFNTNKGVLSTEDLFDLSLQDLNVLAKALNKQRKEEEEEDFLSERSPEDVKARLGFDIVLYILEKKKEEKLANENAKLKKAERQKILNIIAKKKDASLENLSEEELLKKLDEL